MINPLFFAKHVNPSLRPLGTFEHFFWLLDQNRPVHFALAAQVQGATEIEQWRNALDLVQRRHPLLSPKELIVMDLSIEEPASLARPADVKAEAQRSFSRQDARPEIENGNTTARIVKISADRFTPSEANNLLDPEDEATDYHLYQELTNAAKEMEFDWLEPLGSRWITSRFSQIAVGFLLLATLIGFSIACWQTLGYVYGSIFSL
ncbi:MAG: hypothetical protein JO025_22115 [Verrucomicrobia bacterium]|nr:hypothetical protein [Verrucomicrobiota bacterium]